jgi:alkylhydroperoxidase/carboxymuconolactone decarboxylase family protein YurZ
MLLIIHQLQTGIRNEEEELCRNRQSLRIRTRLPEIWQAFSQLAQACHDAGPLDEKTRRLVKLAIAVAAGTEGGTHSAVRHAAEAGVTPEEMEHVVLLSITTIGLPAAGRALTWIQDKAA